MLIGFSIRCLPAIDKLSSFSIHVPSTSQRIRKNSMDSVILRRALVLFLLLAASSSILWSSSMADEAPSSSSFITWEDMQFEEMGGGHNLTSGETSRRVIVVAKDGTGDSVTVQGAVDLVPVNNAERVKIAIRPGIYREKVKVPKNKPYISFIGNPSSETVITWNAKASDKDGKGKMLGTFRTATLDVESNYFCATGITIKNDVVAVSGGVGMQAVALRVDTDKAVFYNVRIIGTQDTLLDNRGTHYFFRCYIEGTVDFVFGNARSLYEECTIKSVARKAGGIAASHRNSAMENTGFTFHRCNITGTGRIYLGRAWGSYSRAIYTHCHIDNIIHPNGWSDWGDQLRRKTVTFGTYRCTGKGAQWRRWVPWGRALTFQQARPFLGRKFIDANRWLYLPYYNIPIH